MRRGILLVLLITILVTPVTLAEEQVKDEWLFWDGKTTVDGENVDVRLDNSNEILRVSFLNKTRLVRLDNCRDIDVYEFCFDGKDEEENPDIDGDGKLRPGVNLVVSKYELSQETDTGSPEMDLDVNAPELTLDAEHDVDIEFQNTGDGAMFNFSADITPNNVNHDTSDEDIITVGDNTYRITGGIESDDNRSIPLTVSLQGANPSLNISYEYDTSNGTHVEETTDKSLDTPDFHDVTLDAPDQVTLFDEQDIDITVENQATKDMSALINITHDGKQILGDNQQSNLTVTPNSTTTTSITFIPRYAGQDTLRAQAILSYGLQNTVSVNKTITTPQPNVSVDGYVTRTKAGQNTTINVTVTNDADYTIREPSITIRTPFGDNVITVENVTRRSKADYSIPIDIPVGAEPKAYTADIIYRYQTRSSERFKHELERTITIDPVAYDLHLDKSMSDTNPSINETVTVDVYAENFGLEPLNDLTLTESTNPNVYNGTDTLSISPDGRQRIFSYNFTYNGTPITTTTSTDDDRLTLLETTTISGETTNTPRESPPNQPGADENPIAGLNESGQQNPGAVNQGTQNNTNSTNSGTDDEPENAWEFLTDIVTTIESFFS